MRIRLLLLKLTTVCSVDSIACCGRIRGAERGSAAAQCGKALPYRASLLLRLKLRLGFFNRKKDSPARRGSANVFMWDVIRRWRAGKISD